ncbi:outer membrane beta-barrel protein [Limobrevibacterium gyesilva]|uniref:Outer membrane beta-barrel protein n=1 Tax=Limobrevibacterium gyesilva TaxID=2991712 RepID=A0AA42CDZ7_9PROT|nr:outer membrane beta-barrel protein [Limobrevibacterium gyesilva]MCW3475473.1 outer membrane beta-barrel protein [Limobrevibacterium gyesilva]
MERKNRSIAVGDQPRPVCQARRTSPPHPARPRPAGPGRGQRWPARAALLAASFALAAPASAQLVDTYFPAGLIGYGTSLGVTVASRERPEYDPPGVHAGSFVIRPQFATSVGYDSNAIFRTPGRSSMAVRNSGSVLATTNWSSDNANAFVSFDNVVYPDVSGQNYTAWSGTLGKVFDFGRDRLTLAASHLTLYQTSRDINTPQALNEPGQYQINNIRASFEATRGLFYLVPALQYTTYRYSNVIAGGQPLNQTNRNRDMLEGQLTTKIGDALLRDFAVVLRGASIHYTSPQVGQPNRDADAISVLAGIDHVASAVWRFRALAGYQVRWFHSSAFNTVSAPILEANVIYSPSGLTTVTATLTRAIQDAANEFAATYISTAARLTIDHELWRNVLLNGHVSLEQAQYQQGGGNEAFINGGTGVTWLVNRNVRIAATYDHITKHPTSGSNINEDVVLIRLLLGL